MSKAYELGLVVETRKNEATTTIPAYKFCRLCTTADSVDIITTKGTAIPYGISQEAINPSDTGKVAISGISRVKVSGTPWTTIYVTTPVQVGATANGSAKRLTTTTLWARAQGLHTCSASDIAAVRLVDPHRFNN